MVLGGDRPIQGEWVRLAQVASYAGVFPSFNFVDFLSLNLLFCSRLLNSMIIFGAKSQ